MKKNDFAIFLVYLSMFVVAILIGLFAIKPVMDAHGGDMPISSIALVLISLIVGIIFNALMLELGHLAGAKAGKYRVRSWTIFGIKFYKVDGKRKVKFSSYDGLTGQTKVEPLDVQRSSLSAYISLPLIFFFVEVIALMVVVNVARGQEAANPRIAWLHVAALTVLATGALVFIYDLFPARIDAINDGFLLMLFTKKANRVAYNNLLAQETAMEEGRTPPESPIYDEITDFTAFLNSLTVYGLLSQGEMDKALPIIEKTLAEDSKASLAVKREMSALKLATLFERPDKRKALQYYEEMEEDEKRYIANITTMSSLRAYLMVAAFAEQSDYEASYAIDKVEKILKNSESVSKDIEKSLVQLDVDLVKKEHPTWELSKLPWEEAEEKAEEPKQDENKEEK
ncbi:MAG: hypothetical protein E7179_03060 [Erysipelotrichaceae bacterium]|jgi:tetratricopeptide (TPR) repeat protein|nr:hypothetical protein [Erysipelotrichaceae bacterium]